MPNDEVSPIDLALGTILGGDSSRPDQKAVSFRIDFKNYVSLCAVQAITPKSVSRNQLLNDLLAVALHEVVNALPLDAEHAYFSAYEEAEEALNHVLENEGHL